MIAVCLRRGWTLGWVPISTIYAGEPSHVRPVAHLRHFVRATRAARRLIREARRRRRCREPRARLRPGSAASSSVHPRRAGEASSGRGGARPVARGDGRGPDASTGGPIEPSQAQPRRPAIPPPRSHPAMTAPTRRQPPPPRPRPAQPVDRRPTPRASCATPSAATPIVPGDAALRGGPDRPQHAVRPPARGHRPPDRRRSRSPAPSSRPASWASTSPSAAAATAWPATPRSTAAC